MNIKKTFSKPELQLYDDLNAIIQGIMKQLKIRYSKGQKKKELIAFVKDYINLYIGKELQYFAMNYYSVNFSKSIKDMQKKQVDFINEFPVVNKQSVPMLFMLSDSFIYSYQKIFIEYIEKMYGDVFVSPMFFRMMTKKIEERNLMNVGILGKRIENLALIDSYDNAYVFEVTIIGILDEQTCPYCGVVIGIKVKVDFFKDKFDEILRIKAKTPEQAYKALIKAIEFKDAWDGVLEVPPFHSNCRCTLDIKKYKNRSNQIITTKDKIK